MSEIERLRKRREEVLRELSSLEQVRRGSVMEQYVETVSRDGVKGVRGPYFLYTFKKKNKTVSRRVPRGEQAAMYREQIQAFRRFQKLVAEMTAVGERISDLAALGDAGVKKTPRSKSRRMPR